MASDTIINPENKKKSVISYDTTLRDGMQGRGINLTVEEKVTAVKLLNDYKIDYIEAGFYAANRSTDQLFDKLDDLDLDHSQIVAFSMTRRKDSLTEENSDLRHLRLSAIPIVTVVGKTWPFQIKKIIKTSLDENLSMIRDTVNYLNNKQLVFDAEHFFEAYQEDSDYALTCLETAVQAGAFCVTLCDTNGSFLPEQISFITDEVRSFLKFRFPDNKVIIGIHAHNDLQLATANSLAAVEQGAKLVQGTINGYGERCGNTDLINLLATLKLKMGYQINADLKQSTELAHRFAKLTNQDLDNNAPYVGRHAFTHKGGLHIAGVLDNPRSFEHLDPDLVGNRRHLTVSDLAGKAGVKSFAKKHNYLLTEQQIQQAVDLLKNKESAGYDYETAEASLELLLRKQVNRYQPLFHLREYQVTDKRSGASITETKENVSKQDNNSDSPVDDGSSQNKLLSKTQPETRSGKNLQLKSALDLQPEKQSESEQILTAPENKLSASSNTEAIVRLLVKGENRTGLAIGNGPVNALDNALRQCLNDSYPQVNKLLLTDYSVRILDSDQGTKAVTRVLLETCNQRTGESWHTVGISENIIYASWQALVDSFEYFLT
jgi:2-isopropylmalate synthase